MDEWEDEGFGAATGRDWPQCKGGCESWLGYKEEKEGLGFADEYPSHENSRSLTPMLINSELKAKELMLKASSESVNWLTNQRMVRIRIY